VGLENLAVQQGKKEVNFKQEGYTTHMDFTAKLKAARNLWLLSLI